jgi:hypothetical protein
MSNQDCTDKVYGDYLAEKIGAQLINHAIPGSCNSQIIRSTVRNLQEIIPTKQEILCVLNISVLSRYDLWDTNSKLRDSTPSSGHSYDNSHSIVVDKLKKINDGEYVSYMADEPWTATQFDKFPEYALQLKSEVLNYNYEQRWYDLYYQLYMLIMYFKQNNIKYLIFAATDLLKFDGPLDHSLGWISAFRDSIVADPAVLNFDTINFCDWATSKGFEYFDKHKYGETAGHPCTKAHDAWADFLYNKLTELYGPL